MCKQKTITQLISAITQLARLFVTWEEPNIFVEEKS